MFFFCCASTCVPAFVETPAVARGRQGEGRGECRLEAADMRDHSSISS